MARPQMKSLAILLLAVMTVVGTAACASGPEQQILTNYFRASRMRDNTTLANIATVSFSPTEQGTVEDFDVVSVSEERREPLQIRELTEALDSAVQAEATFAGEKKAYQDENFDAIQTVLEAERTGGTLSGAAAEVQTAWTDWRNQQSEHARAVSDAREALSNARSVAEVSVPTSAGPVDFTQYDGELVSKDVTIDATVATPDGATEQRQMVVVMQQANLTNGPAERPEIGGRWVVTGVSAPTS